jgi:cyclic-di-AMP phosphodiesterase PgpH
LADSVEGAVRSLDDATPNRIEETVKKIVNNKFIDGQLDECNLTLKEINMICAVFTRILSAMYHGRVKYPDKIGKHASNAKKSSDKNSAQSAPDQKPA